jgi:hypothetical protein
VASAFRIRYRWAQPDPPRVAPGGAALIHRGSQTPVRPGSEETPPPRLSWAGMAGWLTAWPAEATRTSCAIAALPGPYGASATSARVNVLLAGLASCSWLTRASTDCSSKPGPVLIRAVHQTTRRSYAERSGFAGARRGEAGWPDQLAASSSRTSGGAGRLAHIPAHGGCGRWLMRVVVRDRWCTRLLYRGRSHLAGDDQSPGRAGSRRLHVQADRFTERRQLSCLHASELHGYAQVGIADG